MTIETTPNPAESYLVPCNGCTSAFNAVEAQWCECDVPMRNVRCPSCGQCLCAARSSAKNAFWSHAPRSLRQDRRRFGVADPLFRNAKPPGAGQTADAPVVVVVDDDEAMRSLVACFVQQLGYRTVVASEPADALLLAQEDDVRVLITDALMPRVDGRELCRRLKATPRGAGKKVILMTSLYTARRFRAEALDAFGVDAYLAKPLDLSALAGSLARLAPLARSR